MTAWRVGQIPNLMTPDDPTDAAIARIPEPGREAIERRTIDELCAASPMSRDTFGRIREAAGITAERGRAGATRRYSRAEVRRMIDAGPIATSKTATELEAAWGKWADPAARTPQQLRNNSATPQQRRNLDPRR
jgi:hypothetical protein